MLNLNERKNYRLVLKLENIHKSLSHFRCWFTASEMAREKNGACKICFQMIQFSHLFMSSVNWILRNGVLEKNIFYTSKHSFEITSFDNDVKWSLLDKMINGQHDTWNFNEDVFFIGYHMLCCYFALMCLCSNIWSLLKPAGFMLLDMLPVMPRPLTLTSTSITLITDQTDFGSVALGLYLLESLIGYKHWSIKNN